MMSEKDVSRNIILLSHLSFLRIGAEQRCYFFLSKEFGHYMFELAQVQTSKNI